MYYLCFYFSGICSCLPGSEEYDAKLNECDCQNGTLCSSVNGINKFKSKSKIDNIIT